MHKIKLMSLAFAAVCLTAAPMYADFITVSSLGTSNVILPVFNQNLGKLNSVEVNITLHEGVIEVEGHDHRVLPITSSNTQSTPLDFYTTTAETSIEDMILRVNAIRPNTFFKGGMSFDLAVPHSHEVTITGEPVMVADNLWQAMANVEVGFSDNDVLNYESQAMTFVVNAGMKPFIQFLGDQDIVIPGGDGKTAARKYFHTLDGFTVNGWAFEETTIFGGSTPFSFVPTFDTFVTFNFTPAAVPEPSSLALLGLGSICGLIGYGIRRRSAQSRATAASREVG